MVTLYAVSIRVAEKLKVRSRLIVALRQRRSLLGKLSSHLQAIGIDDP